MVDPDFRIQAVSLHQRAQRLLQFSGFFFWREGVLCLFFFPGGSLGPLLNDFGTLFPLKFRIIVMPFLRVFCHRGNKTLGVLPSRH